jgi:oligo-1,6-glucosidase
MSVAEGTGNTFQDAHNMVDADRHELNMAYAFEGIDIAKPEGYSLLHFKDVFTRWDSAFAQKGWLSIVLSNHDQARMVSRFGNDLPQYRALSSKMLSTFLLTMRGTPYYYNGDELGMTNSEFRNIHDFRDMPALNEYQHLINIHGDTSAYLKRLRFQSRDNGRTPFQWNSSANAGFTTGTPWIQVNPNYKMINAEEEEKDPNSCLNYFRKLVKLRKHNSALVYGKYKLLDKNNPKVYAYTREGNGERFLILLNFSADKTQTDLNIPLAGAKLVLSNDERSPGSPIVGLNPYEACIYQLQ